MRIGSRSPDDSTGLLVDRENDRAISRSATQGTRRGPRGEPAKAVDQPHIAADNDQVSFDIRCVAGALRDKTRDREIVHIILSPDQLPGEAVQFGQVAGHVIEVDISTVDGRSGRDAALGIACRSRVGCCLVDPLDPELTHGLVVDRPLLETPGILQINSFRERRNLYRQQQQGETLPALHGGNTEHESLRGHVEKCGERAFGGRTAGVQMIPPSSDGRKCDGGRSDSSHFATVFSRSVTNSSAAVGWMPTVASNCALVSPAFTPIAIPGMISGASPPTMCAPTTRWVAESATSFIRVRSSRPESV